jgi:2-(3-amino-3-carboxypropyl)histidine synthase
MEEDRAATNLGPDIELEPSSREPSPPKLPRKRFIGRRAAEERAAAKAAEGGEPDVAADTKAVARMLS